MPTKSATTMMFIGMILRAIVKKCTKTAEKTAGPQTTSVQATGFKDKKVSDGVQQAFVSSL